MENIENKIPNGENQNTQNSSFFSENVSSSNGLEPKLRFPNFIEKWTRFEAENIFKNITDKNHPTDTVLTIQQGRGTLPRDLSGRNILYDNTNTKNYKRVQFGDFIIHLRSFEGGLEMANEQGIVSPAYTILRYIKPIAFGFYKAYFRTNEFINHILSKSVEGIRDGKQISYDAFKWLAIPYCQLEEQQKIADFLSLVDQRIEKQRQLVESLKKYKRGYFQRIISSLETSSFELKNIVDEYNAKSKIQNEFPILSSTLSGIKLQNDYFNKQAASETTIGYKIVPFGYFTYRSMSDTGEFRFNLQNIIEKGIVSPAYPVFKVKEEYNAEFVEYILNETDNIKSQLLIKKEGGTRYALSFSKFQTLKIDLPIKNAQDKTVSQLRFINKVLTNEERILSNLQKLKNGLLQQMFI